MSKVYNLTIVTDDLFTANLKTILRRISYDGKTRASNFNHGLFTAIKNLNVSPYKNRKSFYYDKDERVRDLVFKGYTIPYLVDAENGEIVILEIFKWVNR